LSKADIGLFADAPAGDLADFPASAGANSVPAHKTASDAAKVKYFRLSDLIQTPVRSYRLLIRATLEQRITKRAA
jgi:hypothetical protein